MMMTDAEKIERYELAMIGIWNVATKFHNADDIVSTVKNISYKALTELRTPTVETIKVEEDEG